jgi:hypothetical protein
MSSDSRLIAIAPDEIGLRVTDGALRSTKGFHLDAIERILNTHDATLEPVAAASEPVGDLQRLFTVDAPTARREALADALRLRRFVVFDKPRPRRPVFRADMRPDAGSSVPDETPDFSALQGYLGDAPEGMDVTRVWTLPGGTGVGVQVVDVEQSWRLSHEALASRFITMIGPPQDFSLDFSHGTAVLGVLASASSGRGVIGIAPDARARVSSDFLPQTFARRSTSQAILDAADALLPGDVILVEVHYPGPRSATPWEDDPSQLGFVPAEIYPDDFLAIQHATRRGILVVEAAGNGAQDLDDPIYDDRSRFVGSPLNPFRRGAADSGAIVVGAGAPPPGFNGTDEGPDRSRLAFSNHGSMVDVQGWGAGVATSGYGDLQGAVDASTLDRWYTRAFNGTSSASPCVAGVLACVQGVLRARGAPLLTPQTARSLLRETGSPQTDGRNGPRTQRIGNRPSAVQMLARLGIAV